ncbi:MAG: HU family DNA-binding protein [Spirochaetales bacterium]|nr:HU family DNA-binding protein [Spirochaetales bacterium]
MKYNPLFHKKPFFSVFFEKICDILIISKLFRAVKDLITGGKTMTFNELPQRIQSHMESLIRSSEMPDTKEFHNLLADIWDKKCTLFEQQTRILKMNIIDSIESDDPRGLIIMTYSGSIVSIGPKEETREVEYASIHLRSDVPKTISIIDTDLAGGVNVGKAVKFSAGQLKQTSAAYMIAVCDSSVDIENQKERIREGTIFLTNGFMKINRSIHIDKTNIPEQFTSKSMTRYIAKRYNITGALAKEILDDFTLLIETGMMLGESVPLGRIGRLSLKRKEAQKARIIRHPETGEEITVKAKPATSVPKISFSKYIKEKAGTIGEDTMV